jgi:hypothetical protein
MGINRVFEMITRRIFLTFLLASPGAFGADPPSAETLMDRYVEVTGGRQAYENIRSLIIESTFVYPTSGARGAQITYLAKGDLLYMFVQVAGGSVESGVKGGVAWEKNTVEAPRILGTIERAQLLRTSIDSISRWRELYAKAETTGEEVVEGQPCYRVLLTPKVGNPETYFLSKRDGLLVKLSVNWVIRNETLRMATVFSNYKNFGGILMPARMTQKSADIEFIATIDSVDVNAVIDPNRFNLPPDVLALTRQRAK